MEFHEVLRARRSIRGFKPDPIPQPALDRIFEAVRIAPSACNLQPWKFLILQSPEAKAPVHEVYTRGTWLREAPLIIVALGNRKTAWRRVDHSSSHIIDVSIAMEHLVLAAAAEGLGTCWICAFDQHALHQRLGLTSEWDVVALTPLGRPDATPGPFQRKELAEILEIR
ncbi:MAG: nitroreductase family protein [Lentisphaeria bacterium]|jgi:nitroreductase